MATNVQNATQVLEGLLNKTIPGAQLVRVADGFVEHVGSDAIFEQFKKLPEALTNEEKAGVVLNSLRRAAKDTVRTAGRTKQRALNIDSEDTAATMAGADLDP